jgi:hypothetical protein
MSYFILVIGFASQQHIEIILHAKIFKYYASTNSDF